MSLCLSCSRATSNAKFCSRSCAAKLNNSLHPKRVTKKLCIVCGLRVKSWRHSRCEAHWAEYKESKYRDRPLKDYYSKLSVSGKHPSWRNSHIRAFARSWNKSLTKMPCAACGYSKHVEICHKVPLSSFPIDTPLSVVNSSDNVVQLCRNCHWEFDNDLLRLP